MDERDHAWLAFDQVTQRNVAGPMRRAKAEDTVRLLNSEGERPACEVALNVPPGTAFEFSPEDKPYMRPSVEVRVPAEHPPRTVMAIAHQVAARVEALSPRGARWEVRVERKGDHQAAVALLATSSDHEHYQPRAVLRDSVKEAAR